MVAAATAVVVGGLSATQRDPRRPNTAEFLAERLDGDGEEDPTFFSPIRSWFSGTQRGARGVHSRIPFEHSEHVRPLSRAHTCEAFEDRACEALAMSHSLCPVVHAGVLLFRQLAPPLAVEHYDELVLRHRRVALPMAVVDVGAHRPTVIVHQLRTQRPPVRIAASGLSERPSERGGGVRASMSVHMPM
ncbi:hypothetical protein B0H14DRAFT_3454749 [Mycena olivaceomarginata]|nr:hypothetical protein B0H14DRAFT_3454749 [Mycena olivaceomarginata]